jgi:hypothetical protein
MFQEKDFILRQIEELGKVLGEIFLRISGQKSGDSARHIDSFVSHELSKQPGFNIDKLLKLNQEQFFEDISVKLYGDKGLYLILGDIFYEAGKSCPDADKQKNYFQKALWLYEKNAKMTETFSFSIQEKIKKLYKKTNNKI